MEKLKLLPPGWELSQLIGAVAIGTIVYLVTIAIIEIVQRVRLPTRK